MEPWGRERHRWANRKVELEPLGKRDRRQSRQGAATERGSEQASNEREHMSQCGQRASFNLDRDLTAASAEIQAHSIQNHAGD
jgi:hypothetical protein